MTQKRRVSRPERCRCQHPRNHTCLAGAPVRRRIYLAAAILIFANSCSSPVALINRNEIVARQNFLQKGEYHFDALWIVSGEASAAGWKLDGDVESATRHRAFVACLAFYADTEEGLPEIDLHNDIERGIVSLSVNGEIVRDASTADFLLVLNHGSKTELEFRQSTPRELAEIYFEITRGDGLPAIIE